MNVTLKGHQAFDTRRPDMLLQVAFSNAWCISWPVWLQGAISILHGLPNSL